MTQSPRNKAHHAASFRFARALCWSLGLLLAACGGMIDPNDPSSGALENRGESGVTLQGTFDDNGRLIVTAPGSTSAVFWADLNTGDAVAFAYAGQRYTFEQTSSSQSVTLVPEGAAATLVVGGRVQAGSQVGLPTQVVSNGSTIPHVFIVSGFDEATGNVKYVFSSCDSETCANGPTSLTEKKIKKSEWNSLGSGVQLQAPHNVGNTAMFTIVTPTTNNTNTSTNTATTTNNTDVTDIDQARNATATARTDNNTPPNTPPKHEDEENGWAKWALLVGVGVAAVVLGSWALEEWGKDDDTTVPAPVDSLELEGAPAGDALEGTRGACSQNCRHLVDADGSHNDASRACLQQCYDDLSLTPAPIL